VLNSIMDITRAAGKLGIPGRYVTGDPGAVDEPAKVGSLSIRIGLGWAKSHSFTTGQCPVMRYNRQLMMAILYVKVQIAKNVNATVIPLDQAPQGYQDFDKGAARKYILDPTAWSPDYGTGGRAFPALGSFELQRVAGVHKVQWPRQTHSRQAGTTRRPYVHALKVK